jgi:uroporphyrinogen III methyltransferase/synthase
VAESVVEMLRAKGLRGRKILILRARGARNVLPKRLREAGATVTVRSLYEAARADGDAGKLKSMLREADFVTVTSGSTVRALVEIASGGRRLSAEQIKKVIGREKLASIGPVTSRVARRLGLKVDIEAKEYTIRGLSEAIAEYVNSGE